MGLMMVNPISISLFYLVFICGLAAAGVSTWNYLLFWVYYFIRLHRETQSITPYSELIEKVRWLSRDQISFLEKFVVAYVETPGGELGFTKIGDLEIPDGWIRKFLLSSDGGFLPPIRRFPQGSINRKYAEALTDFLIEKGVAKPAVGNRSARIDSWRDIAEVIGWQ